mgnify:CR=1 FL=1
MHQGPDSDKELEYQSAEEGGNDEDDDADEIDDEGSEEDERNAEQYEKRNIGEGNRAGAATIEPNSVCGQEEGHDCRNLMSIAQNEGNEVQGRRNTSAIGTDENTRTNIEAKELLELNEDVMEMDNPIYTSSVVADNTSYPYEYRAKITTTEQGNKQHLQEPLQEIWPFVTTKSHH